MSIAKYRAAPKAVGARLREARERRGDHPGKVAHDVGISLFQLHKIERGEVKRATAEVAAAIERLTARYDRSAQPVQAGGKEPAMDASRLKDIREKTDRLFELTTKGNEIAQQHWTHLEHQIRTLLRDAEREG